MVGRTGIPAQRDASDILVESIQERRMELLVPERDPKEKSTALENPREGGTEEITDKIPQDV